MHTLLSAGRYAFRILGCMDLTDVNGWWPLIFLPAQNIFEILPCRHPTCPNAFEGKPCVPGIYFLVCI